jgi:hypothetical protein
MALRSSASITYTGSIAIVPPGLNGVPVKENSSFSKDLPFLSSVIKWDKPLEVPSQFTGNTLQTLLSNSGVYKVNTSVIVEYAGETVKNLLGRIPQFSVEIRDTSNRRAIHTASPTVSVTRIGLPDTLTFDNVGNAPILPGTNYRGQKVTLENIGIPVKGIFTYTINDWKFAYVRVVLNIEVILNCTGDNLEKRICVDYCQKNMKVCSNEYFEHCFPQKIGTSNVCQNFVADYIQQFEPNSTIDNGLMTYCKKYKGINNLLSNGSQKDIDLCACHLDPKQYDNLSKSLIQAFPNLKEFPNIGIVQPCMLPECASSNYKSTKTGKKCAIPQCLNIGAIGIDGNVSKSNVTVNQNVEGCANIGSSGNNVRPIPPNNNDKPVTPVTPDNQEEEEEDKPKINWTLIGIIAAIAILLLIIIAVVVIMMRRKSK